MSAATLADGTGVCSASATASRLSNVKILARYRVVGVCQTGTENARSGLDMPRPTNGLIALRQ